MIRAAPNAALPGDTDRPPPPPFRQSQKETAVALTDLERTVIFLGFLHGERPRILSGRSPGHAARWRELLFGHRRATPLADERLEALRAMAAAVRNRPRQPDLDTIAEFMAAGWSMRDVADIQEMARAYDTRKAR